MKEGDEGGAMEEAKAVKLKVVKVKKVKAQCPVH